MPVSATCPRCGSAAARLSTMYLDAAGNLIGQSAICLECGPRFAETVVDLPTPATTQDALLERRAS